MDTTNWRRKSRTGAKKTSKTDEQQNVLWFHHRLQNDATDLAAILTLFPLHWRLILNVFHVVKIVLGFQFKTEFFFASAKVSFEFDCLPVKATWMIKAKKTHGRGEAKGRRRGEVAAKWLQTGAR